MVGMRHFRGTFETRKRLFMSAFSICMTVRLTIYILKLVSLVTFFLYSRLKLITSVTV